MPGDHVREGEDEQDAEEEARERHAHQRHAGREQVDERIALHRREDANAEREGDRDRERGEAELEGRGQPLGDRLHHPLLVLEGAAEVALERVTEPGDVLDRQRLIEPELLPDGGEGRGVPFLAREDEHGVGRGDTREREDADGHEERDRDHEQEAAEDVSDHSVASALICSDSYLPSCAAGNRGMGPGYASMPVSAFTVISGETPKPYQTREGSSTV